MPSVNILDEAQISTLNIYQLPFDYQVPAGSLVNIGLQSSPYIKAYLYYHRCRV